MLFILAGLVFSFQSIKLSMACSPPTAHVYTEEVSEDKPNCLSLPNRYNGVGNECERHLRIEQLGCGEECRIRDFAHSDYSVYWYFDEFDVSFIYKQNYKFTLGTPYAAIEEAFDDNATISSYNAVLIFEPPTREEWEDFRECEEMLHNGGYDMTEDSFSGDMVDDSSEESPKESGCSSTMNTAPQPLSFFAICFACIVGVVRRSYISTAQ